MGIEEVRKDKEELRVTINRLLTEFKNKHKVGVYITGTEYYLVCDGENVVNVILKVEI